MTYVTSSEENPSDTGEYKGNWKRDKRHGKGVMKYNNGSIFEGRWMNDQKYKGIFYAINGEVYEGRFYNNEFHGKGKLTVSSNVIIEGEFCHGVLKENGKLIRKTGNGEGNFSITNL